MRIAVLSDGYPPWEDGGAQRIAAQLAEGYRERDHTVGVITAVVNRDDAGAGAANGVRVRTLWTPKSRAFLPYLTIYNPFVVRGVGRALDAFDPDVIHAHNVHYLSNASLRAADRRAPVLKTFHDAGTVAYGEMTGYSHDRPRNGGAIEPIDYRIDPWRQLRREGVRYNPIRNWSNRRTFERSLTYGVAVSDALRAALRANGVPCHGTIRNGVDAGEIARAGNPARFRTERGLGDAPVVLFGGRAGYNKGGAHLAQAFAATQVPDAKLVVTGDGEYVSRMRAIAGPAGRRIVTTGWLDREELGGGLRAATVVATPSVHLDPFPTLNLEAFAAGTPVVTSQYGGANELVDDGEDGFVVNPFDVPALADALESLLADSNKAAAFGERGRRKVQRAFTVEGQLDDYIRLLGAMASE